MAVNIATNEHYLVDYAADANAISGIRKINDKIAVLDYFSRCIKYFDREGNFAGTLLVVDK